MSKLTEPIIIDTTKVVDDNELEHLDNLTTQLESISHAAYDIEVVDDDTYIHAVETYRQISAIFEVIESIADRFRKPAYDYYKSVLAEKKKLMAPGEKAISHLRLQLEGYDPSGGAPDVDSDEIVALIESGELEKAQRLMDIDGAEGRPDIDGVHYRETWNAVLSGPRDDAIKALCGAIAAGHADPNLVKLNSSVANKLARKQKSELSVPGLEAAPNISVVIK